MQTRTVYVPEKGWILSRFVCRVATAICFLLLATFAGCASSGDRVLQAAFVDPPLEARPGALWCWMNGHVDHEQMTREMEEAKALGMRGFEIWDIGVIRPVGMVPAGPAFLGEDSLKTIKHAMTEAKRLGLELNMIAASSWNAGGSWVKKSDGSKRMASSAVDVTGPDKFDQMLPLPCDSNTYYFDVSVLAVPQSKEKKLASLHAGIDLTGQMDDTGRLQWDVPHGDWTILRFVCRGTNQGLVVPSPNSDGLIIDHLSADATERHMMHMINTLGEVDPGHKILKIMSHDSYEVHPANDWTEDFGDEFKKRRHYDPEKYLPLLEGWKLDNTDVQTRFMADYRKTVGELITERHFRLSREILNRHGMQLCAEAGHGGYPRVDPIWALGQADIPRGEFWNGKRFWVTKEAASAANLYGRRYVDSESFTGWRHWLDGPSHYKQLFDVAICDGLNRLTFHTFSHNPPEAGLPGYVYHAGEHFNANNTWWKQSGPMLKYMARCSYLMQQGTYVADACFYYGDKAPNLVPPRRIDPSIKPIYAMDKCLHCGKPVAVNFRTLGQGYGYDYIDARSILDRMTVDAKTGQLVVGDMRYRVLVLPDHDHMCLEVLEKIQTLVEQGATIVGSVRPMRTNSLTEFPKADDRVAAITRQFWPFGENNAHTRTFGQGKVFTRMSSREVLDIIGVTPDFTVLKGGSQEGQDRVDYIHRRIDNADVYFVCNSAKEPKTVTCRFRDADGRAEIWCPVTGDIRLANVIKRHDEGACDVELQLPAIGSAFVVFRRDGSAPAESSALHVSDSDDTMPVNGPWTVTFQPGRLAPASVQWNELIDWTTSPVDGIKYFSGTARYTIEFDMPREAGEDFWLDLGRVSEVAEVRMDGQDLGTAWTYPFRVKVPAKLLSKGSHMLEVAVTNVWNNRLVGDLHLDETDRVTSTNKSGKNKKSALVSSGLLGPVTLEYVN
ncbi:MAG: hypothetical protein HQ515_22160 [Phycisphaeraceae bacterium]|nr:hypothetical protein [Phycisphaeraceae bacterium]